MSQLVLKIALILFVVLTINNSALADNCIDLFANEYLQGNIRSKILSFNDKEYAFITNGTDPVIVEYPTCFLLYFPDSSKEIINSYLFMNDPQLTESYNTYLKFSTCYDIVKITDSVCSVTKGINEITGFILDPVTQEVSNYIPGIAKEIAPYGWKTTLKKGANTAIDVITKSASKINEFAIVFDVANYFSCSISDSWLKKMYESSYAAYIISNSSRDGLFYTNSTRVLSELSRFMISNLENNDNSINNLEKLGGNVLNTAYNGIKWFTTQTTNAVKDLLDGDNKPEKNAQDDCIVMNQNNVLVNNINDFNLKLEQNQNKSVIYAQSYFETMNGYYNEAQNTIYLINETDKQHMSSSNFLPLLIRLFVYFDNTLPIIEKVQLAKKTFDDALNSVSFGLFVTAKNKAIVVKELTGELALDYKNHKGGIPWLIAIVVFGIFSLILIIKREDIIYTLSKLKKE